MPLFSAQDQKLRCSTTVSLHYYECYYSISWTRRRICEFYHIVTISLKLQISKMFHFRYPSHTASHINLKHKRIIIYYRLGQNVFDHTTEALNSPGATVFELQRRKKKGHIRYIWADITWIRTNCIIASLLVRMSRNLGSRSRTTHLNCSVFVWSVFLGCSQLWILSPDPVKKLFVWK